MRTKTIATWKRGWALSCALLLLAACGDDGTEPVSAPDTGVTDSGSVPDSGVDAEPQQDASTSVDIPDVMNLPAIDAANAVGPESPLFEGQQRFLWDAWGVERLDFWPPTDFLLQLMEQEPEVFGNQFEKFGLIPDPNDDLPIGLKRGIEEPDKIRHTCAVCHVGRLPSGELWLGLPNRELDMGRLQVEVNRRWVAAGNEPVRTELQEEKDLALGPGRTNAESPTYPRVIPADFPPYFSLDRRSHYNYLGTGRDLRTEVFFAIFTFGAGYPNDEEASVPFPPEERIQPFIDFLGSLRAPPAPSQDPALVERGEEVFTEAQCGACHHPASPEDDEIVTVVTEAPELLPGEDSEFPRGTIRTSPDHRLIQSGDDMDSGYEHLLQFILENQLRVRRTDGYRTNYLGGLWTTAPYLHNGSVPTLEDLLEPASERPTEWMNGDFLFDTSLPGNSNQGHEFGVDLSEEDKAALIAYLRSL